MENYQVIVTPDAENDLVELRDYISDVLLVPETARSVILSLREAIGKLSYLAPSFAPIEDEPWHKKGIRKTTAKNFIIYYRLDEETKRVYTVDVLNVKCDPMLAGSLRQQEGFHPAYHMNKDKWLTARLDGSAPDDEIKSLIDLSYELTATKKKRKSGILLDL